MEQIIFISCIRKKIQKEQGEIVPEDSLSGELNIFSNLNVEPVSVSCDGQYPARRIFPHFAYIRTLYAW